MRPRRVRYVWSQPCPAQGRHTRRRRASRGAGNPTCCLSRCQVAGGAAWDFRRHRVRVGSLHRERERERVASPDAGACVYSAPPAAHKPLPKLDFVYLQKCAQRCCSPRHARRTRRRCSPSCSSHRPCPLHWRRQKRCLTLPGSSRRRHHLRMLACTEEPLKTNCFAHRPPLFMREGKGRGSSQNGRTTPRCGITRTRIRG